MRKIFMVGIGYHYALYQDRATAMILTKTIEAWGSDRFAAALKQELREVGAEALGLHRAMARGSHLSETPIDVVVLHSEADEQHITVRAGVFFSSIVAGSCCADDPTPLCEENEYGEVTLSIDRDSGAATVRLLAG